MVSEAQDPKHFTTTEAQENSVKDNASTFERERKIARTIHCE